ncbi:DNA-binding NtrC family response regulator [Povalibacter uvarum]|uniref:DNA-binding NtrC family response regulator n=1 Tax=Povalibacter uvarum TaxID=732238 RepID=A0A841HH74_9GAMM|nr:response regulator [Povalibacter uvarum]MBB6091680.1 DNA-binding NtrC family response regulator [Povalibacter uvarum]
MAPVDAELVGRCLLVVEDDYLVASDLASTLQEYGAEVIGPVGTVEGALALIDEEGENLAAAVLDINLHGERAFGIADVLNARHVPFVFVTGYSAGSIPTPYADHPRCDKPVDMRQLVRVLRELTAAGWPD